jgi:hypothetical protein
MYMRMIWEAYGTLTTIWRNPLFFPLQRPVVLRVILVCAYIKGSICILHRVHLVLADVNVLESAST